MNLTREEVLAIAKTNMMEYVHETYLIRFVEQIIAAEKAKNSGS